MVHFSSRQATTDLTPLRLCAHRHLQSAALQRLRNLQSSISARTRQRSAYTVPDLRQAWLLISSVVYQSTLSWPPMSSQNLSKVNSRGSKLSKQDFIRPSANQAAKDIDGSKLSSPRGNQRNTPSPKPPKDGIARRASVPLAASGPAAPIGSGEDKASEAVKKQAGKFLPPFLHSAIHCSIEMSCVAIVILEGYAVCDMTSR